MKLLILCFSLLIVSSGIAQLNYTENTFDFTVDTNVQYGTALNYAGLEEDLYMDIYKPVGDENCTRPCMVLIHGGAWIAGSKNDAGIENMAKSFAEKGWVVAAINYRLGTHKTNYHVMYAFCNDDISTPCGYIADSAEIYRANFRGQQDAKGAIRFMKNRWMVDSTDVDNYFVTGESAGGFVAYASAFMNTPDEKSELCEALPNAPTPDPDLVSCLPAGYSLERPDLGDVKGENNLGGFDATVQGVGSFYGGMMDLEMLEDETDWPVVYMYHQGSDVVVNYNYGRLLGRIDWECYSPTNLCQNYAKYPRAFGSKGINDYLSTLATSPERIVEIVDNYEYMNDCFDNGHSIDNWVTRSTTMINLFAERIAENGNTPNDGPCNLNVEQQPKEIRVAVFPNPTKGLVNIHHNHTAPLTLSIYTIDGRTVMQQIVATQQQIDLPQGVYIFEFKMAEQTRYSKVIVN